METTTKMEEGNAPPPTYEATLSNADPPNYSNEAPPSYESVFGRVRQMRDESDGNAEFAKKMIGCVMCGTVFNIIMIIIMIAIPVACIIFGSLYMGECPRERYIPIYLVVAGVFGLIKAVLGIVQQVFRKRSEEENEHSAVKCLRIVDSPISCFLTSWFIAGSVWVYRIHGETSDNPSSPYYCNPTLYQFAFWILTVQYILFALAILCCCFGFIVICCVGLKRGDSS